MAKKKGSAGLDRRATEALLDTAGSRYELVVAWDPSRSQPIRFVLVMAGAQILIADRLQTDSPVVLRRLPAPSPDGTFDITWTLTPEVSLRAIAIAIVDTQTNARRMVDTSKDLERGKLWRGSKSVRVPQAVA